MRYLILLILLTGCAITDMQGRFTEVNSIIKEDGSMGVFFCPRENCSVELSNFILSAEESAYCAFFDLDLEEVKNALEEKFFEGLDVKLIVDTDNVKYVKSLSFEIKQDGRSAFMHNKFCIIDGKKVSTGSMNPTLNGDTKNNNNLIIVESKTIAKNYEDEFFEMWGGQLGKGGGVRNPIVHLDGIKVENYFCPEDKCSDKIENVLKKAEESIHFMTFSFTHEGIANELLLKNMDGVLVEGVFEKRGAGSEYSKFKVLDYQGMDVVKDNNSAVMHHKVFIIDSEIVITGSFNPSKNADFRNDENILIIYDSDIASRYMEEYEYVRSLT